MGDHQRYVWDGGYAINGLTREQESRQGLMKPRTILLTMGSDGFWSVKDEGMRGVLDSFTTAEGALEHALNVQPDQGVWA